MLYKENKLLKKPPYNSKSLWAIMHPAFYLLTTRGKLSWAGTAGWSNNTWCVLSILAELLAFWIRKFTRSPDMAYLGGIVLSTMKSQFEAIFCLHNYLFLNGSMNLIGGKDLCCGVPNFIISSSSWPINISDFGRIRL